jgi:hypothetical protein
MENLDYPKMILRRSIRELEEISTDTTLKKRIAYYQKQIASLKAAIEILEQHKNQNT